MDRIRPAVLAVLAYLLMQQAALAQMSDRNQLATVEAVAVVYVYEIHPACLLSPGDLKDEAEWILRNSGITVADSPSGNAHELRIDVVSRRAQEGECMAGISSQLGRFYPVDAGAAGGVKEPAFVLAHQDRMSVHTGPEPGFTAQLRRFIRKSVTGLASKIVEARGAR